MKMKHPNSPKTIEVRTGQVLNYQSQGWVEDPKIDPATDPKPDSKPDSKK